MIDPGGNGGIGGNDCENPLFGIKVGGAKLHGNKVGGMYEGNRVGG